MGARSQWRHATRCFATLRLALALTALVWGMIVPAGAKQGPSHAKETWSKEIPITVFIEPYAEVTPSPAKWLLSFTGAGRLEDGWRFVARPAPQPTFVVHANTDVQVTLSGGGGVGKYGVSPVYTFAGVGQGPRAYASGPPGEGLPYLLADIAGPTGDAGVVFTLTEAEILAPSLSEVPAGRLGKTTLTVTVMAASD
ncbi:hypothetical protein [Limnochorda pilosa]|uniref:Uncharacterized protein n=1 Tax=Limnochorda pilosa TaxID=1555112 RepID=A0A0K2SKV3_LIMPI|nr:hypothetical protein [Limnochorda pilosa]BAS27738.1 hypothetical protein LIP_1897 [Limnochorda pilosa]